MKAIVYGIDGKKQKEIDMPTLFSRRVREDIVAKCYEAYKITQPYASDPEGGKKHSASGTISHKRHDWKGHYGRGISRLPRKTMWRRGTQFHWIGAEVSGTRGGRRAHPPKGIGSEKKINRKELRIAMESGFAATANKDYVIKRYDSLTKLAINTPVVLNADFITAKTKERMKLLRTVFTAMENVILQEKTVRAGKGKLRGRKYKQNAGLLIVTGTDETIKMNKVTVRKISDVTIADLYPLGRLTAYTEQAIKELTTQGEKKQ